MQSISPVQHVGAERKRINNNTPPPTPPPPYSASFPFHSQHYSQESRKGGEGGRGEGRRGGEEGRGEGGTVFFITRADFLWRTANMKIHTSVTYLVFISMDVFVKCNIVYSEISKYCEAPLLLVLLILNSAIKCLLKGVWDEIFSFKFFA